MNTNLLMTLETLLAQEKEAHQEEISFARYYNEWLKLYKNYVSENTYDSYSLVAKAHILPYFYENKISLQALQSSDVQEYYDYKKIRVYR